MGMVFQSIFIDLLMFIIFLCSITILYVKYIYKHWARHNIPHLKAYFPFGNTKELILRQETASVTFQKIYQTFKKRNVPFGGYYLALTPELLILDPEIIKDVLVKNFKHFTDRGMYYNEVHDPLSAHLFSIDGAKWKNLRNKVTPAFSSGKLKMMFSTLLDCAKELNNILEESVSKSIPLNIKEILARFTTDIIGTCAFGIECNCLKYENTEFRKYGSLSLEPEGLDAYTQALAFMVPNVAKILQLRAFPKNVINFFMKVVRETVEYREENKVTRKDFMQLLLQLRNQGQVLSDFDAETIFCNASQKGLTIEEIAAHCFLFFIAGFETSSTTMSFCLYELVRNLDIQEKLREEINTVVKKYDNQLTYDAIMEMHYLDKVINETLRKYPPLAFLHRACTEDYKLPNSNYTIRKGNLIRISVLGIHNDPQYYPDPDKFDPERFSETERAKRIPYTYLPFGEGPRNCIGLRFGMMQVKVGISTLLKNHRFTLNKKTPDNVVMDPKSFILSLKGGIWLDTHNVL